jgi:hypothetical protein
MTPITQDETIDLLGKIRFPRDTTYEHYIARWMFALNDLAKSRNRPKLFTWLDIVTLLQNDGVVMAEWIINTIEDYQKEKDGGSGDAEF